MMASEDLRETMALHRCSMEAERSACYAEVDAILTEIEQAGYVVIERERWERVQLAAWKYEASVPASHCVTKPGDLDPPGGD